MYSYIYTTFLWISLVSSLSTILPGNAGYTYNGCYNETTGDASVGKARALTGGSMNASDSMTVQSCLSFCGNDKYAGLEYARECWCAPDLNSYAAKLPDAECDLPCSGNSTEVCGGALTITLYQRKSSAASFMSGAAFGVCFTKVNTALIIMALWFW